MRMEEVVDMISKKYPEVSVLANVECWYYNHTRKRKPKVYKVSLLLEAKCTIFDGASWIRCRDQALAYLRKEETNET